MMLCHLSAVAGRTVNRWHFRSIDLLVPQPLHSCCLVNEHDQTELASAPCCRGTTFVNLYFVFTKGAKKSLSENSNWSDAKSAWIAAAAAGGLFVITAAVFMPLLKW